MKNKYRIVRDRFAGYEAQVKFWWFPFLWFQMWEIGTTNTHSSVNEARNFINLKRNGQKIFEKLDKKVVEYVE